MNWLLAFHRDERGFLLPLIAKAAPLVSGFIGKILGGGGGGAVPPVSRALAPVVTRALPAVRRALPALRAGGRLAAGGAAFGAGAELVQRIAPRDVRIRIGRDGQEEMVPRRRRINPTNIRALRRAARRIRSFQRATRKVARLVGGGRRVVYARALPRRRRSWRGDILPFEHNGAINQYAAEDYADYLDEMEDLGYDPGSFQEEEAE